MTTTIRTLSGWVGARDITSAEVFAITLQQYEEILAWDKARSADVDGRWAGTILGVKRKPQTTPCNKKGCDCNNNTADDV